MILEVLSVFILFLTKCTGKLEPFIAGGEYAKIENYPHSVFLYITCAWVPEACGGSILTQQVILTAGHCFESCIKNLNVVAYAGSDDTERMLVAAKIVEFRVHKKYNKKSLYNDIALGALQTPLTLGMTIKRVIIKRDFPGVLMARTAGWGIINEQTQQPTQKLKMVTQIIQVVSFCKVAASIRRGMMCAKNNVKNHPSRGDSGSALVSGGGQQIGLVSFRNRARKELVVYTNVSYYFDWIKRESKHLSCKLTT